MTKNGCIKQLNSSSCGELQTHMLVYWTKSEIVQNYRQANWTKNSTDIWFDIFTDGKLENVGNLSLQKISNLQKMPFSIEKYFW